MSWTTPASTRSLALLRMGFAMLLWVTWGLRLVLNYNLVPAEFAVAAIIFVSSTMMFMGLLSRLACAITGAGVAWIVFVMEYPQLPLWPDLHVALMIAVPIVLAFSPCGQSYSFDRWLALRRADKRGTPIPSEVGDVRALGVLTTLLIGTMFIQALTMSTPRWLSGYALERILLWQSVGSVAPGPGLSALLPWLQAVAIFACISWWALVIGLSHPATRSRAIVVGVVALLLVYFAIPLGTGLLTFAGLYLALVDPDRVHAIIDELGGYEVAPPADIGQPAPDGEEVQD